MTSCANKQICYHQGDILVRPEDQLDPGFARAHLANPNRLWPSKTVAYKFWRTFPQGKIKARGLIFTTPIHFLFNTSLLDLRNRTRRAMDYITNLFPCITFIPAEVESPNYVTIYPGTYIPYTPYTIYHTYHIPNYFVLYWQYTIYPGATKNIPRQRVRK